MGKSRLLVVSLIAAARKMLRVAILTLLSFNLGVAVAQAMPLRSAQAGLIVPVGSGCGIGVHRGPYDGCNVIYGGHYRAYSRGYYDGYRDGYYDGYYDSYYDGFGSSLMVDQGACSGRRMYRVCDVYGICWAACN